MITLNKIFFKLFCILILLLGERKRKEYQDDGLINDNESDAETGASLKKRRKKKGEGRKRKSGK